ncbi:ETC complex I subunit conserved region-domain-containing protein [Russula brevipes]|nr:ETC complex I subunit conserved region-domain-containing protein [Russula brevipes]
MSLLRACSEALAKPTFLRSSLAVRPLSTEATPQTPTATKEPSEIAPIPQKDVLSADVISGAPAELRHRVVRIYQPTSNTMQSGGAKGNRWRLDWDILPGGGRWENPLMGWASSADYVQGTRLSFRSKEDAIHFSEKQGESYLSFSFIFFEMTNAISSRLGLLCATTIPREDSSQELCRELCL